ncbi:MAG: hypothetical protein JWO03_2256 [Bacteroidetes bacterium]|nr:hypothetical protein [Bacteroidota bacterium]
MSTQNNNSDNGAQKVHDADLLDPFGYPVYEEEYNAAHKEQKDNEQKSPNEPSGGNNNSGVNGDGAW